MYIIVIHIVICPYVHVHYELFRSNSTFIASLSRIKCVILLRRVSEESMLSSDLALSASAGREEHKAGLEFRGRAADCTVCKAMSAAWRGEPREEEEGKLECLLSAVWEELGVGLEVKGGTYDCTDICVGWWGVPRE